MAQNDGRAAKIRSIRGVGIPIPRISVRYHLVVVTPIGSGITPLNRPPAVGSASATRSSWSETADDESRPCGVALATILIDLASGGPVNG